MKSKPKSRSEALPTAAQAEANRQLNRVKTEEALGIEFGEPILAIKGLTFKADGYEGPYIKVTLTLPAGKTSVTLQEHDIHALLQGSFEMLKWCEKGWCPGAC